MKETKNITSTIGEVSAKSIIFQYKYIVSNLLFYKFYTNYIDIIDNLTIISAEAIDNAMTVLVKTMGTISD